MKMKKEKNRPEPSRKGFVTNYPPFRHWKKLDSDEMLVRAPINIYLHIPFCLQRCAYCYYRTTELKGREKVRQIEQYVNSLCKEIEIASQSFHLKERPVHSIYIGGGTPTILKVDQLTRIAETLHKHLNIDTPEFTVEAEPATLTQKKADLLKSLNVNRISLGVQSFRDEILKLCKRLDNEEKALKAIETAKATGAVVNIDLLSGLAGETPESWAYTIERALSTKAESITVYKMELYANTDYYRSIRNKEFELPSEEQELEFMRYALKEFEQANYLPWCFFTFTRDGLYKNIYASSLWEGTDCYSFGASGFGSIGHWLFQNTNEVEKYITFLESGDLPINRGYSMTSLDQMIRTVMLGMKLVRLDLNAFQAKYGFRLESLCSPTTDELEEEGLITLSADEIAMTSKGILYGDYVGKRLAEGLREIFDF